MNLFAAAGLSCGVFCIILSLLALLFGKRRLHRILLAFNIVVAVWGLGLFFVGISDTASKAILGWKFAHAGAFFIGPIFYHLTTVFCGKKPGRLLYLGYVQAFFFTAAGTVTDIVFNKTGYIYGLYYNLANPVYSVAVLFYLSFVILSYIMLLKYLPKSKGYRHTQALYMIYGFLFGFLGGTATLLPMFKIDFYYPLGTVGIILYCLIVFYAIIRHRLMDFHIVLKKSLVYTVSVGFMTGIFIVLALVMTKYVSAFVGISSFSITVVSALITAVLFAPLKNSIQFLVDKAFYKSIYNHYAMVQTISHELTSIIELRRIYALIVDTLFDTLKLKNSYLLSAREEGFETVYFRWAKNGPSEAKDASDNSSHGQVLNRESGLVKLLEKQNVLIREELRVCVDRQKAEAVENEFSRCDSEAAVPIFIDDKPVYILMLGEKLSGFIFSIEDINMFRTIANQAAIALKNALLYNELEQRIEDRTAALLKANHDLNNEIIERKRIEEELHNIHRELETRVEKRTRDLQLTNTRLEQEITERKKTEELLYQSKHDWEDTFDVITDMITVHDTDFNIICANRAAKRMLGLPSLINADTKCFTYYHGTAKPPHGCTSCDCLRKEAASTFEVFEPHLNKFIEISAIPRFDSEQHMTGLIHVVRDITKRKETEKQLEHQAFYDQLTNLPNRTLFTTYLEHVNERTMRDKNYQFAVLFIDLDRFKIINDSLGHIVGDLMLVAVARRLEACIRPEDMISRFGGDEYVIFLESIKDASDTVRLADRIQKELMTPFDLDGHEVFITASIGISLSSSGYNREEDIIREADSAMYRAKANGRACYEIFDSRMHDTAMKLLQLEADLRRAVKNQEFIVYYQPIVSMNTKRIVGVEALLRWQHPQRGIIPPMEFIPLAEETGLISTIGELILRTACTQNIKWQNAGFDPLLMKVNFSVRQFQKKNLLETVKKTIEETKMPAQFLDVEITESIATEDNCILLLNELSALGVQISIDDFGTGYSSLGYLKQLPINAIKIDKSFVKDIAVETNAEGIVKAIIAVAHSLKIRVVAEGVETEEQKAFLQAHHCDEMQGYLFSPPVSANEFTKLLDKARRVLL